MLYNYCIQINNYYSSIIKMLHSPSNFKKWKCFNWCLLNLIKLKWNIFWKLLTTCWSQGFSFGILSWCWRWRGLALVKILIWTDRLGIAGFFQKILLFDVSRSRSKWMSLSHFDLGRPTSNSRIFSENPAIGHRSAQVDMDKSEPFRSGPTDFQ